MHWASDEHLRSYDDLIDRISYDKQGIRKIDCVACIIF